MHGIQRQLSSVLAILVLVACTVVVWMVPNTADAGYRDLDIVFEQLAVSRHGRSLVVEYEIASSDWQMLRETRISPRLNLYISAPPFQSGTILLAGQELVHRSGRLIYPIDRRRTEYVHSEIVEVQLVGHYRGYRIHRMRWQHDRAERVRIRIAHPSPTRHYPTYEVPRPVYTPPSYYQPYYEDEGRLRAEIIRACQQRTAWRQDFEQCMALSRRLNLEYAVETIQACNDVSRFGADFQACLRAASGMVYPAAPVITACAEAVPYASDRNRCISTAARFYYEPLDVINACAEATRWPRDFQQCLESNASFR